MGWTVYPSGNGCPAPVVPLPLETMTNVDTARWTRTQAALRYEVARVADLLRAVRNPTAPAIGQWTLAEVAMHLSQAWLAVPGLVKRDLSPVFALLPECEGVAGESLMRDVWDLGGITMAAVQADPERDPKVIADRIEERAAAFFAGIGDAPEAEERAWLVEGVRLPLPVFTGHLLHETLMHGYDIARADGRRWPIEPAHAALVIEEFYVPVLKELEPRAMVDQAAARGRHVAYAIHLRGAGTHVLAFDDCCLTIASPASFSGRIDCHISADPAAFLEVALQRRSQWSAIARGQLLPWGRKPWLAPKFRSLIRNP